MALANEHTKDKVQGYLQLSVTVLGPGDKPHVRERRAPGDVDASAQLDALQPQENADLVLIPPTIQRKQEFLVVTVYAVRPRRAGVGVHLLWARHDAVASPPPTGPPCTGTEPASHGFDRVCRNRCVRKGRAGDGREASYEGVLRLGALAGCAGGSVTCTAAALRDSQHKSVRGRRDLFVVWNQELWLPFMSPSMTNRIAVSVYDHNMLCTCASQPTYSWRDSLRLVTLGD